MSADSSDPVLPVIDGAMAEQIYNAGRIAGLQEASEFVGWLQDSRSGSAADDIFASMRNVFAERATRWWDTLSDERARSLVEQVPATPWDKRFTEADRSRFTLVFEGDLNALTRNVFDDDMPWGRASRVWIGDAVEEIGRFRALLRKHGVVPDAGGGRTTGAGDG